MAFHGADGGMLEHLAALRFGGFHQRHEVGQGLHQQLMLQRQGQFHREGAAACIRRNGDGKPQLSFQPMQLVQGGEVVGGFGKDVDALLLGVNAQLPAQLTKAGNGLPHHAAIGCGGIHSGGIGDGLVHAHQLAGDLARAVPGRAAPQLASLYQYHADSGGTQHGCAGRAC